MFYVVRLSRRNLYVATVCSTIVVLLLDVTFFEPVWSAASQARSSGRSTRKAEESRKRQGARQQPFYAVPVGAAVREEPGACRRHAANHTRMTALGPFLLLAVAGAAARRELRESDLQYGLDAFHTRYNTRRLFKTEDHFHRRLFEHETALPHDTLQTFLATLHKPSSVTPELSTSLEDRGNLTLHTVVDGDLLMHGTRVHADALREQPEVRAVVPLLPELKVTPHFDALLGSANASRAAATPRAANLIIRLVPWERHSHLRPSSDILAATYADALTAACAARPEWKGWRACASDVALRPRVAAEGPRTLVVSGVERKEALAVAELLSAQPQSLWVEPQPVYVTLNADAAAITQSGSVPPGGGTPVGTYPIHLMGLHGENEVIGVGDSCAHSRAHAPSQPAPLHSRHLRTPPPSPRPFTARSTSRARARSDPALLLSALLRHPRA